MNKRGQSMVEFVLVLPVFLILLLGMIEFGLIFNAYITINNAAREGARVGSVGGTDGEIEAMVNDVGSNLELANLSVAIQPGQGIRSRGDALEVVVTYQYDMITPFISNLLGGNVNLEGRTVMRVE